MTAAVETLRRAQALADVGRYAQAAELLVQYLASDPGSAPAWAELARCRSLLDDNEGALHAADQSLAADPSQARAWQTRAAALADLGRYPEALASAQEAVRAEPGYWGGHLVLASTLLRQGRSADAYEVARRVVHLEPEESRAHYMVGISAQMLRNYPVAEQAYRESLRLDPENTYARNNLSVLHMNRRLGNRSRWSLALEGFADVAAVDLEDRTARYNLEVMVFGAVAKTRWIAALGLFAAVICASASGAGQGFPPEPGALGPRLAALAVIAALWAAWAWRVRSRVPVRLRRPLVALGRRSVPVMVLAGVVALMALVSVLIVAVPWTDAAFLGATVAPSVWLVVLSYWICRAALRRRRPKD
ncbi:tetratricopeptide repeat protein [Streptomyces sp. NPDC047108]|uniref:tetratricopeptide repeat protein n=1 Tax=Streptomyces sp. NPDC047108 TaxID=3155025 RepID=UPI0033ED6FAB